VNLAIRRSLQEISLLELAGMGVETTRFAALEHQLRGPRGLPLPVAPARTDKS
jgi:hypothetical protein